MSKTECLFQSFEGTGSIYLTVSKSLPTDQLKKYQCEAFALIYGETKGKGEKEELEKLDHITIKTKDLEDNLGHLFLKFSNFIDEAKKKTSIMIWSPQDWQMGSVFIFAHLIMKSGHTLEYIYKLNERKIKNISISQRYTEQLQKLYNKELPMEEPKVPEKMDQFEQTVLGKKILRIRKKYSELGMESHAIAQLKRIQSHQVSNPQKSHKQHKAHLKYNQQQTLPLTIMKKKSTTNSLEKQQSQKNT